MFAAIKTNIYNFFMFNVKNTNYLIAAWLNNQIKLIVLIKSE